MLPEDQHEEIGDKAENVGQGKGKAAHVDLGVQQSFRHQHGRTGGGAKHRHHNDKHKTSHPQHRRPPGAV